VTRPETASFLVRMFNLPPSGLDFFTDDETSIHENDINAPTRSTLARRSSGALRLSSTPAQRRGMISELHRLAGLGAA